MLDDGRVVSFGYNYRGQLGHGNTTSEPIPKSIRGLDGIRVTQVSCSYYHSIIGCDNEEVGCRIYRSEVPVVFGAITRSELRSVETYLDLRQSFLNKGSTASSLFNMCPTTEAARSLPIQ